MEINCYIQNIPKINRERVVVLGSGSAGLELAGTLAEMKKYVFPEDCPGLNLSLMKISLFEDSP